MPKNSSASLCIISSDAALSIDYQRAEHVMRDIREDLQKLFVDFHKDADAGIDSTTRARKMHAAMVKIRELDKRLLDIHNLLYSDAQEDDLVTNYGMSIKLDSARERLNKAKITHDNLRKEWHCQDEHLNRIAAHVEAKDQELKFQSVFCTRQGLVLSKMLWKASQTDQLLDLMVAQDTLALEVVKTLDGCLYAFTQTYGEEMPEPSADEYQYVLCLCGILGNLASVPDGRFLLISRAISRDVYNQIIKIIPNILVPQAEDLKFLMLTAIYNIMICKEGEEYAKSNPILLKNLGECLVPPHSTKIIILTLKIISNLTSEIHNKSYMDHINSFLPKEKLEELQCSKDSCTVRKQAKQILGSMTRLSLLYSSESTEKLIGTTQLDLSRLQLAATQTSNFNNISNRHNNNYQKQKIVTYRVATDETPTNSDESSSSSETEVSSTSRTEVEISNSFLDTSDTHFSRDSTRSRLTDISSLESPRTSKAPTPPSLTSDKHVTTKYGINRNFSPDTSSALCRPSILSLPLDQTTKKTHLREGKNIENTKTLHHRFPQMNFGKLFAVTIGDNIQNSQTYSKSVNTLRFPDGQHKPSIITVFRISRSNAMLSSHSSFAPFYSAIGTNTSFALEANMKDVLQLKAFPKPVRNSLKLPAEEEQETFDVAYGGYGAYYEKTKIKNQPATVKEEDGYHLPSTSSGNYECSATMTNSTNLISNGVHSESSTTVEVIQECALGVDKNKLEKEENKSSKKQKPTKNKFNFPFYRTFSQKSKKR